MLKITLCRFVFLINLVNNTAKLFYIKTAAKVQKSFLIVQNYFQKKCKKHKKVPERAFSRGKYI